MLQLPQRSFRPASRSTTTVGGRRMVSSLSSCWEQHGHAFPPLFSSHLQQQSAHTSLPQPSSTGSLSTRLHSRHCSVADMSLVYVTSSHGLVNAGGAICRVYAMSDAGVQLPVGRPRFFVILLFLPPPLATASRCSQTLETNGGYIY